MVRRRTASEGQARRDSDNGPRASERHADAATRQGNGASKETGVAPADGSAPSPHVQRAEELVDRVNDGLRHYAEVISSTVRWLVARAREEAEDIWAEAQALRDRQREQR